MRPAAAAYVRDPGGRWATAYGIMVLTIDGSVIGEITGFADPALFPFFGLPGQPGDLMAYDEDLADRVRGALPRGAEVTERKMFGGLAFLLGGHMFAGVVGDELMVRVGYQAAERALERDHVREMDFTGRPAKNMIFVQPAGLRGTALRNWVTAAADHARSLPPKPPRTPKARAR